MKRTRSMDDYYHRNFQEKMRTWLFMGQFYMKIFATDHFISCICEVYSTRIYVTTGASFRHTRTGNMPKGCQRRKPVTVPAEGGGG